MPRTFTILLTLMLSLLPLTLRAADITTETLFTKKDRDIERQLKTMSLPDKIGQMIIAHFPAEFKGPEDKAYLKLSALVSSGKTGGIMFLKGNVSDAAFLANRFQLLAPYPLLISADMEKGLAMRIEGATEFAPSMALSATSDPSLVYRMAKVIAEEARALGIVHSYGPSTDLNINPDNPIINTRSYGDRVEQAVTMATAFIDGLQDNRVIATVKHFPGHGDVTVDSHLALPVLEADRKRLEELELKPFQAAIDHGVLSVMIGHLAVPEITESRVPATLSWGIVTGLLRKKMGFDGLVVTDALNMKALYEDYTLEEISVLAVEAGNDLLLFSPDPELTHKTVLDAVRSGRIPLQRIDDAVRRILQAKKWLGLDRQRIVNLDNIPHKIGISAHQDLARTITERSLTVVRDTGPNLPLRTDKSGNVIHIILEDKKHSLSGEEFEMNMKTAYQASTIRITPRSKEKDYRNALEKARLASAVVISSYVEVLTGSKALALNEMQESFVRTLSSVLPPSTPLIMISFGTPYLVRHFPDIPTYLCTYTSSPLSGEAVIKALEGKITPEGRLPVTLSASNE
ncbi:MAG TPA: glycoside hydrolase family 3 protein [Prosthecochloris aestuarii]|uniref:beta-N-acetylhexosaminidase n=1 Tax=Prosthecochloris aestuarii TaxID=1102 RepID=A0A831STJ9_PROAE|nr:glycoside hydrolase family 3 protein [Prosthecochloris aestuarii]